MNTLLELKIKQYSIFDEKDIYEIYQIFNFVSDEKKRNILNNFDKIVNSIIQIKENLKQNQEILLGLAISNIEQKIKEEESNLLLNRTKNSINRFKQII